MRVCHNDVRLVSAFLTAQREAEAAFGSPDVYIEKFIEEPRHIEIQLLGDSRGNVIHLGERDCTVQRRHQKLIEESPSPCIDKKLRKKMGEMAVRCAKSINYENAGTIEFLLDKNNHFYFMEMNTRVQVEHPVTEMLTGIDIIKEQLKIAFGENLKMKQDNITFKGSSIECRIYAEDPEHDFRPCPGKIAALNLPGGPGVRVDTHIYPGYTISPYYDSLIAKIITYGDTRKQAIAVMRRALDEFMIDPIKTTVSFHKDVLRNTSFIRGKYSTAFAEKMLEAK